MLITLVVRNVDFVVLVIKQAVKVKNYMHCFASMNKQIKQN